MEHAPTGVRQRQATGGDTGGTRSTYDRGADTRHLQYGPPGGRCQSRKVRGSAFTEHGSSRSMALAITSRRATGDSLVAEFVAEHGPTAASTDEGRYMPSAAWARATESGLMYNT